MARHRRWVGYGLLLTGLALLFDTYTFLSTNWSPLRVPMLAPTELSLGYFVAGVGIAVLVGPLLVRSMDNFAPDASMKMGGGLAHQSVELRRKKRLPFRSKFTVLPNRGLVGSGMVLLLLLPVFLMVTYHIPSVGIYVQLTPRRQSGPDENCLEGPIVVAVVQRGSANELLLNGTEVRREELERALKSKLVLRSNWQVFVHGDESVAFADPMSVIDIIKALGAKAVILTPKLKQQLSEGCKPFDY